MGMDWKILLGAVLGLYGAGFALSTKRPRVYQAISEVVTNFTAAFTTLLAGVYLGSSISSTAISEKLASDSPELTISIANGLVAPAEKLAMIAGWATAAGIALFVGHMIFIVLAYLSAKDDIEKARQPKG